MSGASGMLTFRLKGSAGDHYDFLGRLRVFTHAVSLGHDESLIMFYAPVAGQPDPYGVAGGFFRVSIGLEDPEDLVADLRRALDGSRES
jgi:methionine-gamma-lyase